MRHLTETQLLGALSRGATVEQHVSSEPGTFAWLSVKPRPDGLHVILHHVQDDGDENFADVYEFTSVDEGGEDGHSLGVYPDFGSARLASEAHGAHVDRWVNEGLIQDEYAASRR